MPIAHAEGNYFIDDEGLERLEGEGQVVFRYARQPQRLAGRHRRHRNARGNVVGADAAPRARAELLARHGRRPSVASPPSSTDPDGPEQGRHRAARPDRRRVRARPGAPGREPNLLELGIFSVMWSEHCSYKSSRALPARAADHGPARPRRARARTPAWSTSATGWRWPSRWRATTTRATSSPTRARRPAWAASCATSSPWARGRSRSLNSLRFGDPTHPKTALPARGRGRAASAATATASACPPSAARSPSTSATTATAWSTPSPSGVLPERPDLQGHRRRASATRSSTSARKTGRDGIHGATMASAEFDEDSEEQAADGAGGRSRSPRSCCSRPASS